MDLLTGFQQPQPHSPRGLVLGGISRVSNGREHQMGTDWDVAALEYRLGLFTRKLYVFLQIYTSFGPSLLRSGVRSRNGSKYRATSCRMAM